MTKYNQILDGVAGGYSWLTSAHLRGLLPLVRKGHSLKLAVKRPLSDSVHMPSGSVITALVSKAFH